MELAKAVVVVPAHNEVAHLPRCLRALATAALCVKVPVLTVVVLAYLALIPVSVARYRKLEREHAAAVPAADAPAV